MKNPTYQKRKEMGVCTMCGNPQRYKGFLKCYECTIFSRVKDKERRKNWSPEYKRIVYENNKKWRDNHPEKLKEYKGRYNWSTYQRAYIERRRANDQG